MAIITEERKSPSLRAYRAALLRYMEGGDESCLAEAYELGRSGLHGAGVMHIVHVHSTAVNTILAATSDDADVRRRLTASAQFLVEAMSPFEIAYRGYRALVRSSVENRL